MPRRQLKYPSYRILIAILLLITSAIIFLTRLRQKPTPIEASWAPTASSWSNRKQLTIANNSGATLSANTTYSLTLNTKDLYDSGLIQSDCQDIRVYYQPDSSTATKLNYYIEVPGNLTCATSTATTIHFPLQADLSNNSTSPYYYLYLSNTDATSESSISAFDIGDKNATFYCGFKSSTTCINTGGTVPPTTATGAIRYSSPSALSFDGVDDQVSGNSITYQNQATFEAWVYHKGIKDNKRSGIFTINGHFEIGTNNRLRWRLFSPIDFDVTTNSTIPTNQWVHLAGVWDGINNTVKLFINGNVDISSTANSGTFSGSFVIGISMGGREFNGYIDEVRFSNVARYTANFTPQTTPFVRDEFTKALYHFDENGDDPRNSGKAIDDSGNNNHGTITGAKYVAGIVGINSSTLDSGTLPPQSYASHGGIFLEEGTTNLITNPSFEHSTYNTGWTGGGNDFTTFTPNVSKRNAGTGSTAPFAAGVMIQGQSANASNSDLVYFSPGSSIGTQFSNNLDQNQGSISFWLTPEWNGNDGLNHQIFWGYDNTWWNINLVKNSSNNLVFTMNSELVTVNASSWLAGSTYHIVLRWDRDNSLDGTNYASISINDSHTFGRNTAFSTNSIAGNQYIGSRDTGSYSANAIIEGLTIYRRPLWDGQYGINAGNGDEIAQIFNSGVGVDPTQITGSWDVVFALPTDSSIGSLGVGGTGQAWSHPHSSNVLYTSTTNTGGFMMNGTYSNDGWALEGSPSNISGLTTPEKIFSGGYKWDSDDYNEGIKYTLSGLTAGQNYVIRAIANSGDGTGQPKIFIYDETNGADITSFTGTIGSGRTAPDVMLFTFELPTSARNGVASDCTSISVKLVNASNSGSVHFHQIELLTNRVDNPSLEVGSTGPYIPSGWTSTYTASEGIGETVITHSGYKALKSVNVGGFRQQTMGLTSSTARFYSIGWFGYRTGGYYHNNSARQILVGTPYSEIWWKSGSTYVLNSYVTKNVSNSIARSSAGSGTAYTDDVYVFNLQDVSLTVTPATQANSIESDQIRVDGADTYSHTLLGVGTTTGSINFNYTPRHSPSVVNRFGSTMPYIAEFYGDSTNYIRLFWSATNTIKLEYSMVGTTASSTWDASSMTAGTNYQMSIGYTGGGTMSFILDGTSQISLSSIPANFATAPSTAYWGTNQAGINQADATYLPSPPTITQNTTSPYYKFGSNSLRVGNSLSSDPRGYIIPINPGSTAVHTLSAYVYDYTTGSIGGTISSSVAQLVFNGSAIGTTYTDTGGGWWRLSVGATTDSGSQNYGIQVKSGKTVYIDGVQLEQKTYQTTYADGNLGVGYSWSSTANQSSSSRTSSLTTYSTTNNINNDSGTITFWAKPDWSSGQSTHGDYLISNTYSPTDNLRIVYNVNGTFQFQKNESVYVGTTLTQNNWYLISASWDSNNIFLSINGSNATSTNRTANNLPTSFTLGNKVNWTGVDRGWTFSNLNIYDSKLTDTEVSSLYYSGLASHQLQTDYTSRYTDGQPPVSYWKLDEGVGSTLNDSISTYHGSLSTGDSAPTWATGSSCISNNCLSFDGTNDYGTISSTITGLRGISFWLKPTSATTSVLGLNSTQTISITNNVISANGLSSPTIYVNGQNTTSLNLNEWSHVLITSPTSFAVSGMTLGKVSTNYFSGYLDEIKIYSYIPTDTEIKKDINLGYSSSFGHSPQTDQITPLKSKLIAHYKFDEGYGSTAHDTVGANHGTFGTGSSAPTWTQNGKVGKALSFDGNDFIDLGSNSKSFLSDSAAYSVSFWIKTNSITRQTILGSYSGISAAGLAVEINRSSIFDDNGFIFSFNRDSVPSSLNGYTSMTTNVNDNSWHHVTQVVDTVSNTINIFLDGQGKVTTYSSSGNINSLGSLNNNIYLGANNNQGVPGTNLTGIVDEVKIYNYALTGDEIKQDYNQGMSAVIGKSDSDTGSTAPAGSSSQEYCVPGDTSPCSPPIAEWTFDKRDVTYAFDTSGNSNHGTLGTGNSAPTYTPGKIGNALSFDGQNDYVLLPSATRPMQAHTISFWVKPNTWTNGTYPGIMGGYNFSGNDVKGGMGISMFNNTTLYYDLHDGTGARSIVGASVNDLPLNTWTHVTTSWDGTTGTTALKIFINGVLIKNTGSAATLDLLSLDWTSYPLFRLGFAYRNYFSGSLDQVRIYNYARTPAQIAWDYNRGAPIAHYKMDEIDGSTAHDSSGNNLHGTLGSGSSAPTWVSGKFGNGLSFDGNDSVNISDNIIWDFGTNDFSYSGWIKTSSTNGEIFWTEKPTRAPYSRIAMENNKARFTVWDGTNGLHFQSNSNINDNNWHHVVGTRQANIGYLYIDGVLENTQNPNYSVNLSGLTTMTIGKGYYNLTGNLDDIRIYNYALTPDQVKQVYNNGAVTFR